MDPMTGMMRGEKAPTLAAVNQEQSSQYGDWYWYQEETAEEWQPEEPDSQPPGLYALKGKGKGKGKGKWFKGQCFNCGEKATWPEIAQPRRPTMRPCRQSTAPKATRTAKVRARAESRFV